MEKKTFYIEVGSGEITEPEETGQFEFEIQANDEEINQLQALFEESAEAQEGTAKGASSAHPINHNFRDNDASDYWLREIYRKLYDLGTPETKKHIESMNMLH